MKKSLSFVLAIGLLFLLGCAKESGPITTPTVLLTTGSTGHTTSSSTVSSTTPNVTKENIIPERQTYISKSDGFKIQFPGTWNMQEKVYNSSVMFFSPTDETDKIRENVSIKKTLLTKTYTLDEYYPIVHQGLTKEPGFQEIENSKIKINNIDAQKIIFKSTIKNNKLQFEEILLIKNNAVYTIVYTATESTFNDYAKKVDEMIATFIIK